MGASTSRHMQPVQLLANSTRSRIILCRLNGEGQTEEPVVLKAIRVTGASTAELVAREVTLTARNLGAFVVTAAIGAVGAVALLGAVARGATWVTLVSCLEARVRPRCWAHLSIWLLKDSWARAKMPGATFGPLARACTSCCSQVTRTAAHPLCFTSGS